MLKQSLKNIIDIVIPDAGARNTYKKWLDDNIDYSVSVHDDFFNLLTLQYLKPLSQPIENKSLLALLNSLLMTYKISGFEKLLSEKPNASKKKNQLHSYIDPLEEMGLIVYALKNKSRVVIGVIEKEKINVLKVLCEDVGIGAMRLSDF